MHKPSWWKKWISDAYFESEKFLVLKDPYRGLSQLYYRYCGLVWLVVVIRPRWIMAWLTPQKRLDFTVRQESYYVCTSFRSHTYISNFYLWYMVIFGIFLRVSARIWANPDALNLPQICSLSKNCQFSAFLSISKKKCLAWKSEGYSQWKDSYW